MFQPHMTEQTTTEVVADDTIFDADDSSRLACQILTGPQTDGLIIALATDSVSTDPVSSSPVPTCSGLAMRRW